MANLWQPFCVVTEKMPHSHALSKFLYLFSYFAYPSQPFGRGDYLLTLIAALLICIPLFAHQGGRDYRETLLRRVDGQ